MLLPIFQLILQRLFILFPNLYRMLKAVFLYLVSDVIFLSLLNNFMMLLYINTFIQ